VSEEILLGSRLQNAGHVSMIRGAGEYPKNQAWRREREESGTSVVGPKEEAR
jgi:hypothetical protein